MEPVHTAIWHLHLLANLDNKIEKGGTLIIDSYTFDPHLVKGDIIQVQDLKVGVASDTSLSNKSFSFSVQVMDIQKVAIHHEAFIVNIILESPDLEVMAQLREAFRARNPEKLN